MKNKMNELYKIAGQIENPDVAALLKQILDSSELNDPWMDFYHLTMAQTLFLDGQQNSQATFEMFIRRNPFKGAYTISSGLGPVLEWLNNYGFSDEFLGYLAGLKYENGQPKFTKEFLEFLRDQPLQVTIEAVPEGELIFPNEPIVRVTGPEWQVGIIETAILNGINAASFIATKASRIKRAARGKPVMEFGLRRAQDRQGRMSTRAAATGGILVTSNVGAAKQYDLIAAGTHAHSFVMGQKTETEAFEKWLALNPNNATVLIDTYDIIQGIKNAISASQNTGVKLKKIRIDSGDLAFFSVEARKLLDAANMADTKILVSNDLDEYIIESLLNEGAAIDEFGVGTSMVTGADKPEDGKIYQPALGGVYKLKVTNGRDCIKVADEKTTIPGATDTIRMLDSDGKFDGDVIVSMGFASEQSGVLKFPIVSINPKNRMAKTFDVGTKFYKPMTRVVTDGIVDINAAQRDVKEIGKATDDNLAKLDDSHKRFLNAHIYVAGIEESLFQYRQQMIDKVNTKTKE